MDRPNSAVACFREGFNCTQAILKVFGDQFGLEHKMALKLGSGLGIGLRMGLTCGAVVGAYMIIGLQHGPSNVTDIVSKAVTCRLIEQFTEKFKARNGSVVCKELLKCDVSTPEGLQIATEKELLWTYCPKLVQDAAEILEEILKTSCKGE